MQRSLRERDARNHYVSKMLSLLCRKGFSAKPRLGISADAGVAQLVSSAKIR